MPKLIHKFLLLNLIGLLSACGGSSNSDDVNVDLVFPEGENLKGSVAKGQFIFGLAANSERITNCNPGEGCDALFEGTAEDGETPISSNGRVCLDCHRPNANFQIGSILPLNNNVPEEDPLLKFIDADAQFNPDAKFNLNEFGLILIRPHRFSNFDKSDPYIRFNAWRKIPSNFNTVFGHGFAADLREINLQTTDIAASMSHTQLDDVPFKNIIGQRRLNDLSAFQSTLISDPRLEGLLHPNDSSYSPSYNELIDDPYLTVNLTTPQENKGKELFNKWCYTCHNVPQIFSNRSNADNNNPNIPGQGYDIGISQVNKLGLDYRYYNLDTAQKELVTVPLKRQNGENVNFPITTDIGLAAITRRYEDLYVFKVPPLRNLEAMGTYMHDGSLRSIEEVVKYFNSEEFRSSAGGKQFPIYLSPEEEQDLIAFLKRL